MAYGSLRRHTARGPQWRGSSEAPDGSQCSRRTAKLRRESAGTADVSYELEGVDDGLVEVLLVELVDVELVPDESDDFESDDFESDDFDSDDFESDDFDSDDFESVADFELLEEPRLSVL